MTGAVSVQGYRDDVANGQAGVTASQVNHYAFTPTHELLDQQEWLGWAQQEWTLRLAGDYPDAEAAEWTRDLVTWQREQADRELRKRRSIAADSNNRTPALRLTDRGHVDFAALKALVRLEDLIPERLETRGRDRLVCRCPLPGHDDSSPSFTVYVDQQTFHCYGCGRGGDAVDFARHLYGEEQAVKAAERLAEAVGIPVPRTAAAPEPTGPVYLAKDGTYKPVPNVTPARRRR